MLEFTIGFLVGCALAIFAILSTPMFANLQKAHFSYTRCNADGGTQAHCVERYLLPEKEVK